MDRLNNSELTRIAKFISVGVLNTIISLVIMFVLYRHYHTGYWVSTAIAYFIGSAVSFCANRNFTFKYSGAVWPSVFRFCFVVIISYLIAYSIAQPFVSKLISDNVDSQELVDQISMVVGMFIFVAINYFGQKRFAFR